MTEEMIRRCKKRNKIVLITILTLLTIALIGSLIWIYATENEEDPYETLTAEERRERFKDDNPESTTYLVTDNFISRVRPNTSYESFISTFDKDEVKVYYDINCLNEVTSGNIASGMYAKYEENDNVYPISVLGDLKLTDKNDSVGVMGSNTKADSNLNEIECTRLIRASVGDEKWKISDEISKKSADINCNNEIDKGDIKQILNYVVFGKWIVPEVKKVQAPELNVIAGYENEDGSYEGRATIKFTSKQENGTRNIYRIVERENEYIEIDNNGEIELNEAGDYTIIAYTYGPDGNKSKCSVITLKLNPGLYTLTLVAGDNVTQTQGGGTYKVGDKVEIKADLVEPSPERAIIWQGWTADNNLLNNQELDQNPTEIIMPKGNVTLTANALSKDNVKPIVTVARTEYNTISWLAEDGGGISGYAITRTNEEPLVWITTGDLTRGKITVTEPGPYYIWARDLDRNVNEPVCVNAYSVVKNEEKGGVLNLRINGSNATTGIPVEMSTVVLEGTTVYAEVIANTGYNDPVLKKNNIKVENNKVFTIEENTIFSSTIDTNDVTINIQENGEETETLGYKVSLSTSESMDTESFAATNTGTSILFNTVPNGTYFVFASKSDIDKENKLYTGERVEVNDNKTQCTINYYGLTLVPGTGILSVSNGGYNTSDEIKYLYNSNNKQEIAIDAIVDISNEYTWNKWTKTSEYNMVLSENAKYQVIQMPEEKTILTAYTVGAKYGEYENGTLTTPINTYFTLADAIANCEDGHIIRSIGEADGESEQIVIPEGHSITIDTNGGTLSVSNSIINNGTLTIIDSSNTDGKILATGDIPAIINNGTLNLGENIRTNDNPEYTNGATIEGGTSGIENNHQTGTINFYDGTVIGNSGEESSIVNENGEPFENIIIPEDKELNHFIEDEKEFARISGHAKFKTGKEVNTAMKKLVNGDPILISEDGYDYYLNENDDYYYYDEDNLIINDQKISQVIRYTGANLPANIDPINVASDDSAEPIYIWHTIDSEFHGFFESYNPDSEYEIIYWWSPDSTPALNEDASYMFEALGACIVIDCQYFDTKDVTDMSHMFESCGVCSIDFTVVEPLVNAILEGNTEELHMNEEEISMLQPFVIMIKNHPFDISGFNTSNVTNMEGMFYNSVGIVNILDISNFDTSNVTDMSGMFYYCKYLLSLDVSNFDTSNVTDMSEMFKGCEKIKELDVSNFDTSKVTDMSGMFYECEQIETLDVSNFDTSNVTDMSEMFKGCEEIQELDVSNFDTSNVTDMNYMFYDCEKVKELDVSNFNTSNVTDMHGMFFYCDLLETADVSNFDTSNVTDMAFMFCSCDLLETIDVSNFDTSNVTRMDDMFAFCSNVKELDLSNFDTSNVTEMDYMFEYCLSIETLDLSSFDTSKVTDMYDMFYMFRDGIGKLKTIYVSPKFVVNNGVRTNEMFEYCTQLVGGNGTTYNSNHIDGEYARIDGWDGLPGYFSVNTDVFKFAEYDSDNNFVNYYPSLEKAIEGLTDGNVLVLPADVTLTSDEDTIVITENVTIDLNGHTLTTNKPIQNNGTLTIIDSTNADGKLKSTGNNPAIINNGTLNIGTIDNQEYTNGATIEGATNGIVNNEPTGIINIYDGTVIGNNGEGSSIVNQDGNQAENIVTPTGYEIETTIENGKETAILVGQAIFKTGKEVNTVMRELASGNQLKFPENEEEMDEEELETWFMAGNLITAVKKYPGTEIPQSASPVNVETPDSAKPIYMWFDNGTIYWFSTDETPNLNADSSYMFYYLENCKDIDGQYFNTKNVTNMSYMFNYCLSLETLDVSNFDTRNVTDMSYMFYDCENLKIIDVSNFDTRNVTDMSWMFGFCKVVETLDVSNFDTKNVTSMAGLFRSNCALESIDVSNFDTSNVTSMRYMFSYCDLLTSLDISSLNTSNVTDMQGMFSHCVELTNLNMSGIDTSNVTDMSWMFSDLEVIENLDLSSLNTSSVTNMRYMFQNIKSITNLDVSGLDTSNVTDMSGMFFCCRSIKNLDVSGFDTHNVTNMSWLFAICQSLEQIDVSNFDTSNVTNMSFMFSACHELTSLDVSGLETDNVTDMQDMFGACSKLTSLDLSTFNTSNVTSMYGMFSEDTKLTDINMSTWNTENLKSMSKMFENCSGLITLDLSNFDTRQLISGQGIFKGCTNLTTIYASPKFKTDTITVALYRKDMFLNTIAIRGGEGTRYSSEHTDNEYARIDGWDGLPGYFSINTDVFKFAEYDSDNNFVNYYPSLEKAIEGLTDGNVLVLPADVTLKSDEDTIVITGNVTIDLNGHTLTTNKPIQNNGVFTLIDSTNTDGKLQSTGNNPAIINNGTLNIGTIDNQEYTNGATIEGTTNGIVNNEPTGIINIYDGTVIGNNGEGSSIVNQDGNQAENIVTPTGYEIETTIENGKETAILAGQAIFKTGKEVNTVMRELASGNQLEFPENEDEMEEEEYEIWYNAGETITAIKKYSGTEIPQNVSAVNVEASGSIKPIYMWFDNGTIYWFSTDETPKLNEDASYMFFYLENCTEIDSQYFDTKSVTNMEGLFLECRSLANLDISGFNTSNVTNMMNMFDGCGSLTSLDVSGFNTSNVTNMMYMFDDCESLTSLDVSGFDTRIVTDMSYMFFGCESLTELDVSNFETGNVLSTDHIFALCENINELDVSNFDTSKMQHMGWMFWNCRGLTSLDVSGFDTSNVEYMNGMFSGCENLTSLDVSEFDTSNVKYMNDMFDNCENLTSLDVSGFDTSNVTNMAYMFDSCVNLTTLDVSGFNTSNVQDMKSMFWNCKSLTSLDVSGFDTSNVRTMYSMFWNCSSLTELDLSMWNTSNVTNMYSMFSRCSSLTALDLSTWDTSKVTRMDSMFSQCSNLKTLDISNFNTRRVTMMYQIFYHCSNLETIYAGPDFNADLATTNRLLAFADCDKLVGENGTRLSNVNYSNTSLDYAIIDGLNGQKGYFSINKDIYKYGEYDSNNQLVNIYKTQEEANEGVTAGNTIRVL